MQHTAMLINTSPWWTEQKEEKLIIEGGRPLIGKVQISGAKNAVLPLMVCSLLTDEKLQLDNLPKILDVAILAHLLEIIGTDISWKEGYTLKIIMRSANIKNCRIDPYLASNMRASFLIAGALLTRTGKVTLPLPGGDAIGLRPVNFHLDGFQKMGAIVQIDNKEISLRAPEGLKGASIHLPFPSVGATENLMLAAVLATGKTIITNAACEPEIVDLANCLKLMGASIIGEGTSNISITGVPSLHGANYSVMPDRIELGTYACAAALTNGHLTFPNINKKILGLGTMQVLEELGIELEEKNEGLTARKSKVGLKAGNFTTGPFPSFATDMQPQLMAVSCFAAGKTQITETLFEKRFQHVPELQKMGAQIEIIDNTAFINGKSTLHGNSLLTSDIRAGAALVIAALAASGVTEIKGLHHLNRGYENLHGKLLAINAAVMRNII